jgi:hypothetical protein
MSRMHPCRQSVIDVSSAVIPTAACKNATCGKGAAVVFSADDSTCECKAARQCGSVRDKTLRIDWSRKELLRHDPMLLLTCRSTMKSVMPAGRTARSTCGVEGAGSQQLACGEALEASAFTDNACRNFVTWHANWIETQCQKTRHSRCGGMQAATRVICIRARAGRHRTPAPGARPAPPPARDGSGMRVGWRCIHRPRTAEPPPDRRVPRR